MGSNHQSHCRLLIGLPNLKDRQYGKAAKVLVAPVIHLASSRVRLGVLWCSSFSQLKVSLYFVVYYYKGCFYCTDAVTSTSIDLIIVFN